MLNLNDKVVIITGAGCGIGRATAILCDSLGAKLCLIDQDEQGLEETCRSLRGCNQNIACHGINQGQNVAGTNRLELNQQQQQQQTQSQWTTTSGLSHGMNQGEDLNRQHGQNIQGQQIQGQTNQNNVIKIIGNLTDINILKRIVDETIKRWSKIDILINNAATFQCNANLVQTKLDDFDRIMEVNVRSVVALTQLCVPHLIKSKGCIVNVSSASAKCCVGALPYSMSKGALDQFTKCVALELAEHGVRVNSVNPGHVENTQVTRCPSGTTIQGQQQHKTGQQMTGQHEGGDKKQCENIGKQYPLKRCGTVNEIANAIVFLSCDHSAWTTGQLLNVDGGLSRSCCLRL